MGLQGQFLKHQVVSQKDTVLVLKCRVPGAVAAVRADGAVLGAVHLKP